ncbi:testis-expressed protein 51 isoform X2 [Macrotis lagotis]|uniref:testis-expressed protein 51 isoform X2 n=1 Tax=Macrotis lagotis TaxID=92651 RepID=UPI003D689BCE
MFFLLFISLFPSLGEGSCLRCWPDLLPLVQYDLEILWGSHQPPQYLSTCLRTILLKKNVPVNPHFLDRAHLEEEAAIFFNHLDTAIKEWRSDKIKLLNKIQIHGKGFLQGLQKAAWELKNKVLFPSSSIHRPTAPPIPPHSSSGSFPTILSFPTVCSQTCLPGLPKEIANCISCKKHYVTCKDHVLCQDVLLPQILWIGSSIIFILCVCVSTFGSGLYYFWWRPVQLGKGSVKLNKSTSRSRLTSTQSSSPPLPQPSSPPPPLLSPSLPLVPSTLTPPVPSTSIPLPPPLPSFPPPVSVQALIHIPVKALSSESSSLHDQ